MSDSDSDTSFNNTPPDLHAEASNVCLNLLPKKSQQRYEKQYKLFNDWKKSKKTKHVSENVLLAYLSERSKVINAATLWSEFSMLKSTFKVKENVNFDNFHKVRAFLKQNSVNYQPKKSNILTQEQCIKFLKEAPDSEYLMMKVISTKIKVNSKLSVFINFAL